ncbi:hypothetical protein [Flavobacterium sp. ASW18X]|uniref:hypothetical protein n=1 Tax=Flavobacterium sp. ASW18X TaxID=2572595 RepID=UPI0010AE0380|nr:hypothetical protein [Flavobacterium sp. ASW18X]TKD66535.1 hypothetical protein FBT53_01375 [Flavobacterium sp. ASW18X]
MNSKKEFIQFINTMEKASLTNLNTSYSKINVSKEVWWLNVATHKFENDVHLLLKNYDEIIWIYLPKDFVKNLSSCFKIRPDRDAIDLEISADKNFMYLRDIKSGGSGFDFTPYIQRAISIE